jgi:hypothetical protein
MEVAVPQVRLVASHWFLFYFVDMQLPGIRYAVAWNSLHEFPIHMEQCHRATLDRWNSPAQKSASLSARDFSRNFFQEQQTSRAKPRSTR